MIGTPLFLRRFLNDPTLFLHFCDYLPFEEDLPLDLYNFKSPLPKNDCTNLDWPSGSGEDDFTKFQ
jgi:hypothetical protein